MCVEKSCAIISHYRITYKANKKYEFSGKKKTGFDNSTDSVLDLGWYLIGTVRKLTLFISLQVMNKTFKQIQNKNKFVRQEYGQIGVFNIKIRSLL